MKAHFPLYRSYLLRMWKEGSEGEWRASLINITTSGSCNFSNLTNLTDFLESIASPFYPSGLHTIRAAQLVEGETTDLPQE